MGWAPVLSPQHTLKVVVDAGTLDDAAMVADGLARLVEMIGQNDDVPSGVRLTITTTTGLLLTSGREVKDGNT